MGQLSIAKIYCIYKEHIFFYIIFTLKQYYNPNCEAEERLFLNGAVYSSIHCGGRCLTVGDLWNHYTMKTITIQILQFYAV